MVRQRNVVRLPLHGTGALDVIGKLRKINAALALVLIAFFYTHALLGTFVQEPMGSVAVVLIWAFVVIAMGHVVLCLMTSKAMLEDEIRPPSRKKKGHLVLKWISGIALLSVGMIHCQIFNGVCPSIALVLVAVLAWHGWVGAKSAARDLGASKGAVLSFRVSLCVLAAFIMGSVLIMRA